MMNRYLFAALAGLSLAFAGCAATTTTTAQSVPPARFDTPPNWLDRVSLVSYLPGADEKEIPLGDYENDDATRFMFRTPTPADDNTTDEAGDQTFDEGAGGE